jgi:cytochrome c-type biogenesis protein CcmH
MSKYLVILLCALSLRAHASVPDDSALDAHVQQLASELRCVVCQNQSLADSQAPLALDLRTELRERLRHGDSDAQVLAYLSERYGDFVLYRPPLKSSTWALWFGPGLLMLAGVMTLGIVLRRVPREEAPDNG